MVDTSVGSVPFLNNSVTNWSSGVLALGSLAGLDPFSTVTDITDFGLVKSIPSCLNTTFPTWFNRL